MRQPILRLLIWLALFAPVALPARAIDRPPNVILILADDLGSADLHCYGSDDLETPNLDALAARGMRFTNFYSAAAVCSPSRAALLTGRCPARNGMEGNAGAVGDKGGLDCGEITLPEYIGARYHTALIGKWHLGSDKEHDPLCQGFQVFQGFLGGCIDNWSHFFYWAGPNRHDLWGQQNGALEEIWKDGEFFPDLMAAKAEEQIKAWRGDRFFLFYSLNSPHYPLQPRADLRAKFAHLGEPRAAYAAWVAEMDRGVGRVLDAVKAAGIEKETLIVFLSDHGHSEEERGNFGGGSSGGLRGSKFGFFEGGIRVPCIVSMPGTVQSGIVNDDLIWSVDLLPTILRFCFDQLPTERILDGQSLAGLLRGTAAAPPERALHWKGGNQWAVRKGRWKLITNPPETPGGEKPGADGLFLSDLEADPAEKMNHAAEHPEIVQSLTADHKAWLDSIRTEKHP